MLPRQTQSQMQNPWVAAFIAFSSATLFLYSWVQTFREREIAILTQAAPPPMERGLSSDGDSAAHGRFGSAHLGIVKLGCLDPAYGSLDTQDDVVRLSGRYCGKNRAPVEEVRALHVGRATTLVGLYDPHSRFVSTEFFPLDPGINQVELEIVFKDGKSLKTSLKIARNGRIPAATAGRR